MPRKRKETISTDTRRKVFERDGNRCRYCGAYGPDVELHADHVYPESRGGETTPENLVTACLECNMKKSFKVGMWPMPIGYFDPVDPIAIVVREAIEIRPSIPNAPGWLIALVIGGVFVAFASLVLKIGPWLIVSGSIVSIVGSACSFIWEKIRQKYGSI